MLIRASPFRLGTPLTARVISALVGVSISIAALFSFAMAIGRVRMPAPMAVSLSLRLIFGLLPPLAGGFAVGYALSRSSAPAVANLLYVVISFFSGFCPPSSQIGAYAERIALYPPTNCFGKPAWNAMGAQTDNSVSGDVLRLAGCAIISAAIAIRGCRRDEQKTFG